MFIQRHDGRRQDKCQGFRWNFGLCKFQITNMLRVKELDNVLLAEKPKEETDEKAWLKKAEHLLLC